MKTEEDMETAGPEEGLGSFEDAARDPERLLALARRELELLRLGETPVPEAYEIRLRKEKGNPLTFLEARSASDGNWTLMAHGRSPEELFRNWRDFVLGYWRNKSGISSLEELVLEMDARGVPE